MITPFLPGTLLRSRDLFAERAIAVKSDGQESTDLVEVRDDSLYLPVEANATYVLEASFIFAERGGGTNGDVLIRYDVPEGSTDEGRTGMGAGTGTSTGIDSTSRMAAGVWGSSIMYGVSVVPCSIREWGIITIGPVSGVVRVVWRKWTSSTSTLYMYPQGYLSLRRVA